MELLSLLYLIVKYVLLLVIGLKSYKIMTDIFSELTDNNTIGMLLSVSLSLFLVYFIREYFIVLLILVTIFLYFFGWISELIMFVRR